MRRVIEALKKLPPHLIAKIVLAVIRLACLLVQYLIVTNS